MTSEDFLLKAMKKLSPKEMALPSFPLGPYSSLLTGAHLTGALSGSSFCP